MCNAHAVQICPFVSSSACLSAALTTYVVNVQQALEPGRFESVISSVYEIILSKQPIALPVLGSHQRS